MVQSPLNRPLVRPLSTGIARHSVITKVMHACSTLTAARVDGAVVLFRVSDPQKIGSSSSGNNKQASICTNYNKHVRLIAVAYLRSHEGGGQIFAGQ